MPVLKKKMTLKLGRKTSLFIDLETGVTGLEGVARGLGSRLGRVPPLARAAARLPRGAVGIPSARRKPARRERGSKTPVFFVTGVGKSGTSWLMRMLDSHPEILCKGEGRFFAADWRRANFDPEGTQALASSLYYALLHSE
ncbi:MAG TPA: sulfotransferase, partial [Rubrobacter sp.]|nr:sulfotransferase [Rubrobacter sp.]